jgi:hypothetical protein
LGFGWRTKDPEILTPWLLFQVIKKVRVEQKLVLFYLVNDIVQHSAKKGFTELLDKFKSGIKESMPHLKEEKIAYKVYSDLSCLWTVLRRSGSRISGPDLTPQF